MAVTVDDILKQVAGCLHEQGGAAALPALWTQLATEGLDQGLRDVSSILAFKGLTYLQISTWRDFDSAVLQQALYWTLVEGGPRMGVDVPKEDVRLLDLRQWLKDPQLTLLDAAGNLLVPLDLSSIVATGVIQGTFQDLLTRCREAPQPGSQAIGFLDPATGCFRRY